MKNILVLDTSIMIQKIIKLAFPDNEYNLLFSGTYPVSETVPDEIEYIFVTADLPGEKDGYDIGFELKEKYNCPILIMVPKFVNFNEEKFSKYKLDGNLEKPFTSEILKEAVAKLQHIEQVEDNEEAEPLQLNDIDSVSDSELGNVSDEEFMISDEDLEGISDEDLQDIDFDDEILSEVEDIKEEQVPENVENVEDVETAELEEPSKEDLDTSVEFNENEDFSKPIVDLDEDIEFQDEIEEEVLGNEFEGQSDELEDVSFDEEIDSEMEAIEFEDNEEMLLEGEATEEVPIEEEPIANIEEASLNKDEESAVVEEEPEDVEFEVKEEPQTVQIDEYQLTESEIPDEEPVPFEVGDLGDLEVEEEIVEDIDENNEMLIAEEDIDEGKEPVKTEEFAIGLSKDESDVEIMGAPSGMVSADTDIDTDTDISDVDEVIHEEPVFDEAEDIVEPVGVSQILEDEEIIQAPSGIAPANNNGRIEFDSNDIEKIATRVAEIISDKVLKQVAWEVIPAVAEEVVKNRIKELEEEVE